MPYNPTIQTTDSFVDVPNKMMLIQNYRWNPNGDNNRGDALGRSLSAYFMYKDPQFIEGAKNCWKRIDCDSDIEDCSKRPYYYKGHRYPTEEYFKKDFSRDHTTNTFCLLKIANDPFLKELAGNVKWNITKKHVNSKGKKIGNHNFTLALWGWVKSFAGRWWGLPLFYFMNFFELILYNVINNLCYLLGWFYPEVHQDDYDKPTMTRQKLSKWRQFWASLTYPMYAVNLFAWTLYVLPDSFMKRLLQIMSYPLIGRHNYLHKLMFNVGKVTKDDVLGYKSMKGGRWTTPLNAINDRDVFIIEKPEWLEANVMDVDILKTFWNIRHPEDKITIE